MQRVLVVGPCGAGKSTLARQLGPMLDLPVVHIDQLNWRAGWQESDKATLAVRIAEVTAGDNWLIDGTYGGTLAQRLECADTVVFLDYPIRLCLWRLLRRIAKYHGEARPDMPAGCPEKFNLAFYWYVMNWNYGPGKRLEQRLAGFGGTIIRLKKPGELSNWLSALKST